jgi:hypothetical protein
VVVGRLVVSGAWGGEVTWPIVAILLSESWQFWTVFFSRGFSTEARSSLDVFCVVGTSRGEVFTMVGLADRSNDRVLVDLWTA